MGIKAGNRIINRVQQKPKITSHVLKVLFRDQLNSKRFKTHQQYTFNVQCTKFIRRRGRPRKLTRNQKINQPTSPQMTTGAQARYRYRRTQIGWRHTQVFKGHIAMRLLLSSQEVTVYVRAVRLLLLHGTFADCGSRATRAQFLSILSNIQDSAVKTQESTRGGEQ